jgi:hypothetical protein
LATEQGIVESSCIVLPGVILPILAGSEALGDSAYDGVYLESTEADKRAAEMARTKPNLVFSAALQKPGLKRFDWIRIEKAYGHPLNRSMRTRIRVATRRYIEWAEFEQNVRTSAESTTRVCMIKDSARAFRKAILENPPKIGRDADYYARSLICKHMGLVFDGRDGLQNLAVQVDRDVTEACDRALAELRYQEGSGFRAREMWERWIRDLTTIASDANLPTKVRKDTDKIKSGEPSPFVSLVRGLQACLPKSYRRSKPYSAEAAANIALSTAIVRARAPRRVPRMASSRSE